MAILLGLSVDGRFIYSYKQGHVTLKMDVGVHPLEGDEVWLLHHPSSRTQRPDLTQLGSSFDSSDVTPRMRKNDLA